MGRGRSRDESYSEESRTPSRDRRKRRRDSGDGRSRRKGGSTVDRFIEENELNDDAASRLKRTTSEVRERVMEQGWNVIDNARNASAVVLSRIRKHEESLGIGGHGGGGGRGRSASPRRAPPPSGGGGGGGNDFREGDWNCEACGAHNFAKRQECFKCNAPRDGRRTSKRSRSRSRDRRRRRDSRSRRR